MKEDAGFDWCAICEQCAFYMRKFSSGGCYHPYNKMYSALGFRKDVKKVLGIFKSKDVRCGSKAIYFKQATPETIKAMEAKTQALIREWTGEAKKQKELNERIDNQLRRSIEKALGSYDICLCNSITYDKRNEEGADNIVRGLLKEFDIQKKSPAS